MLLTADGSPNREIAMQLCISENTVKTHLRQIFGKLGARNRTEAVAIAHRNGLLAMP
jgi:DNA-binding CsgD family transcriptional regulator